MAEEKKQKILVVDDEDSLRRALKAALEKNEGYSVSEAADGREGLKKALDEHPDLILLDVIMPKMTGQEVIKELKNDKWGVGASVIFLTNVSDPIKIAEIGEDSTGISSIYDYLVKSDWKLEDVIKKVKERLNA